ncbi:MAG: tRNA-dihydrouridine synthase family protein [Lachnospiraceae bacterium]|nr:tRNA-dihydrouridine synthase family protein [Lachnospiraceae bacterium]
MKFYLAPLEGITGYLYRNAIHDFYGKGVEKYFTPFLTPHTKCSFNAKELNDITPEHNQGMYVVPQVLTNSSEDFFRIVKDLQELGYEEININLGCPSGTVASKGRGAGFLAEPDKLDHFLEDIFAGTNANISLKTRIGIHDPEEFYELLEIYNKYPLKELIIHPRILKEYYKGKPHWDIFSYAVKNSKNPLCYNGDIFTIDDYQCFEEEILKWDDKSNIPAMMLGRGVLQNPALIEQLVQYERSGENNTYFDKERFKVFHDRLRNDYMTQMSGDMNVLYKMKELWFYMIMLFPEQEKVLKKIKKARKLAEYDAAIREIL